MDLEQAIREEIDRRGLTLSHVAKASGVSFSTVQRFMADEREIGIRKAAMIADAICEHLEACTRHEIRRQPIRDTLTGCAGLLFQRDFDAIAVNLRRLHR